MGENVTFLGGFADDFDSQLKQAENILNDYVESHRYSVGSMLVASTTIAFMRFGQSFADLLRIGNGLYHGGWGGVAQDGLRIITIVGIGGAVVGRVSQILAVTQQAGTVTCTWVTTANSLRRTGQRFFVAIEDLAKASGVDLEAVAKAGGTTTKQVKSLIEALKKMNVPVEELSTNASKVEVVQDLLKARGSGVIAFGVEYGEKGSRLGHHLMATRTLLGDLAITDTNGVVFRSVEAFAKVYKDAIIFPGSLFFIKNAALISGAQMADAAGGLSGLVLEYLAVMPKDTALTGSGLGRAQRR